MRIMFAMRYGTKLSAHDRVVGVHFLGELYPGLNTIKPKTRDRVPVNDASSPFLVGVHQGRDGTTEMTENRVSILVPLNRRGPLRLELTAASPRSRSRVTLAWNGSPIAEAEIGPERRAIVAMAPDIKRGINVLDIDAPAGTSLHQLVVMASADPR
ncbi:MAG TPA: hypothetical protein VKB80_21385 [Kofleriaceae bacterium]|nr:hypothetical protein [Kofleriaceae bacterium]